MNNDKTWVLAAKVIFGLFILYLGIASVIFQFRNPTANRAACIIHIVDVLKLEKLPQFQEKP